MHDLVSVDGTKKFNNVTFFPAAYCTMTFLFGIRVDENYTANHAS